MKVFKMTAYLVIFALCLCVCSGTPVKKDDSWNFFHLAQFWPPTSCYIYFGNEYCRGIPKGVTGWTIHGLWPSHPGSEGPQYCDKSLKFDYNQIKSLAPELNTRWLNFNTSGDKTHLWDHEWDKHGTCAMSLPATRGELNYFSSALKLQKPLDLLGVFQKNKIVPSSKVMYKPSSFDLAVQAELGVKPNIVCSYGYKTKRHYLEQIWICFNKTFALMDCPDVSHIKVKRNTNIGMSKTKTRFSDCPDITEPTVYYLPFTPQSQEDSKNQFHTEFLLKEISIEKSESKSIYFRSETEEDLSWN